MSNKKTRAKLTRRNPYIECARCRNKHHQSERTTHTRQGEKITCCPRCQASTYRPAEDQRDLFTGKLTTTK